MSEDEAELGAGLGDAGAHGHDHALVDLEPECREQSAEAEKQQRPAEPGQRPGRVRHRHESDGEERQIDHLRQADDRGAKAEEEERG